MSGKPSSTIGFERRFNPLLSLERKRFIAEVAQVPDKPANMREVLARNQGRNADR
jgi:hydroxyacylglutathione hydrolase